MKLKNTFELMNGMSSIVRYSQSSLCRPESVLEHTAFVACTSLIIGKKLNELGCEIDIEKLLKKCLVHDMDEVITGDIARSTKYHNEIIKEQLDILSYDAMETICEKTNVNLIEDWEFSKEGDEGKIVELVDALAVLWKAHDEVVMRGNKTIVFGDVENLAERISKTCRELWGIYGQKSYWKELLDEIYYMTKDISEALK